ncbi:ABC transporter ATP-binding protein [Gemelliphila palaticanis]|uniref:ABC transporter ATP-binding protein n=1 Tax=Gemelliphila palaticanis TaxID=81950 RepID=A0ABX2SXW4_9BACL|nr:ABC transporter ATP-binding protein [Gemella palaticanis]MBF0715187.1 ABC transporter ATP-binding protein [Gemella palaticanis]NYS47117.1 ABC transporter ATP-binding protein [Gemella palaticanis]
MTLLRIQNISYSYNDNPVLKDINITVNKGETVAIIGTSGVGKSTLFNLIAGIISIQTGTISINDSLDTKGKVSYMLQKDLLLEHKTVMNNIILPLIIRGIKKEEAKTIAEQKLQEFGLIDYKDKYPTELSGGMRQRVSLIRTSMFNQELFLLDEAFSALDALTKMQLHKWYLSMSKKLNLTTLLITHDIDEAITLSDRIYLLKNKPGEIVAEIKIDVNKEQDFDIQKVKYKKEILQKLEL